MPKLQLMFNAALVKEISLAGKPVSIGRKPDNDLVIDNPAVSGHHCRVGFEDGAYFIEDLGSTNGTYLNDGKVTKANLGHNDIVIIAKHQLIFVDESKQAASSDKTVVMPSKPAIMPASANQTSIGVKVGVLRVLKGLEGDPEYELKAMSTYIGRSDRVQVKVQNKGLFNRVPEIAAAVYRKTEGYVIVPVESGATSLNGKPLAAQELLKDGDIIECGATTMQFSFKTIH